MKREVKFRGLKIDSKEWAFGWFTKEKKGSLIVPVIQYYKEWDTGDYVDSYEIDGNTLGEFTGLKDKNGKEIYEGDIVLVGETYVGDYRYEDFEGVVEFDEGQYFVDCKYSKDMGCELDNATIRNQGLEVIGNIYQNPDLL